MHTSMKESLFSELRKRGIIKDGDTEIRVLFTTKDPFDQPMIGEDDFTIQEVFQEHGITRLRCTRNSNAMKIKTVVDNIISIDGMHPTRLAAAFELNADGTPSVYRFSEPTNAKKEIIGKKNYTLPTGHELQDGMRVLFSADKTDSLNEIPFTVRGAGNAIELKKPRGRPKTHIP